MAKEIVPHKMIITLNEDGSFKNGVLQYRVRVDGALDDRRFFTVGLKTGLDMTKLGVILQEAKTHSEKAEKIAKGVGDV